MTPLQKAQWADRRARLRIKMMKILRNIENGEVDAYEFAQLWNYVATTLTLLSKVSPGTLEAAKKEATIAAYMNDEIEDFEVFYE